MHLKDIDDGVTGTGSRFARGLALKRFGVEIEMAARAGAAGIPKRNQPNSQQTPFGVAWRATCVALCSARGLLTMVPLKKVP